MKDTFSASLCGEDVIPLQITRPQSSWRLSLGRPVAEHSEKMWGALRQEISLRDLRRQPRQMFLSELGTGLAPIFDSWGTLDKHLQVVLPGTSPWEVFGCPAEGHSTLLKEMDTDFSSQMAEAQGIWGVKQKVSSGFVARRALWFVLYIDISRKGDPKHVWKVKSTKRPCFKQNSQTSVKTHVLWRLSNTSWNPLQTKAPQKISRKTPQIETFSESKAKGRARKTRDQGEAKCGFCAQKIIRKGTRNTQKKTYQQSMLNPKNVLMKDVARDYVLLTKTLRKTEENLPKTEEAMLPGTESGSPAKRRGCCHCLLFKWFVLLS